MISMEAAEDGAREMEEDKEGGVMAGEEDEGDEVIRKDERGMGRGEGRGRDAIGGRGGGDG